jgi:metal-responsive CopG/Arc/MetJ family transcriptional regulator
MKQIYSSISLPQDLLKIVDLAIEGKGYASRAEYIKFLIRRDLKGDV